ncbi:MAG: FecR family protein [Deltaproteobacteria bacterium]|nr:FecR family protein [Deltaproteobacteria bacterium]
MQCVTRPLWQCPFFTAPLFAVLIAVFAVSPALGVETAGNVIAARKQAWADRAATQEPLAGKSPVFSGDTLNTSPVGRLNVLFLDDSVLMLAPDSQATITEYIYSESGSVKNALNLDLAKGVTRLISGRITEGDPSAMSVETSEVQVGIRGTEVIVEKIADATKVILVQSSSPNSLYIRDKLTGQAYPMGIPGTTLLFRKGATDGPEQGFLSVGEIADAQETTTLPLDLAQVEVPEAPFIPQDDHVVLDPGSGGTGIAKPGADLQQVASFSGTYAGTLSANFGGNPGTGSFSIGIADLANTPTINSVDMQIDDGGLANLAFSVSGSGNIATLDKGGNFSFTALPNDPLVDLGVEAPLGQSGDHLNVTGKTNGRDMNLNYSGAVGGSSGSGSGHGVKQ